MSDDRRFELPELDRLRSGLLDAAEALAPPTPARNSRRWLIVPALAAVTVIVLALALVPGRERSPLTVEQAVASVVEASFDAPVEGADQYLYVRSSSDLLTGRSIPVRRKYDWLERTRSTRETWSKPGEVAWIRIFNRPSEFVRERDRETAADAERAVRRDWRKRNGAKAPPRDVMSLGALPDAAETIVCKVAPKDSWLVRDPERFAIVGVKLGTLPTTPRAVYRLLLSKTARSIGLARRQDLVWQMIAGAMSEGSAALSPEQRAAVIGALAEIPNVKTFGEVDDPSGRPAVGFSHSSSGKTRRIYFDRATGLTSYTDTVATDGQPVAGAGTWRLESFEYVERPPVLKKTRQRTLSQLVACPYSGSKGHYIRARS